jgi:hypothetical protein
MPSQKYRTDQKNLKTYTKARGKNAVAGLDGTADLSAALPDHLREMRRYGRTGVVLRYFRE